MLSRQLKRSLPRSVAAASWRSTARPHQFHGSSRSCTADASNESTPSPTKKTLFEDLFPEEAKKSRTKQASPKHDSDSDSSRGKWASQLFESPARPLVTYADPEYSDVTPHRHKLLVLSAAPKSLVESDFYRIFRSSDGARRGPSHVEGWVSGVLKVVPARDPDTLEPLGHYYILFDSEAAATAYRAEVQRLVSLAREHTPGANHKNGSEWKAAVPRGMKGSQGEDIREAIQGFTLVVPSNKCVLEPAGDALEELPGLSLVDRIQRSMKSKYLVLIALEGGMLALDTLKSLIEDDGVERNLQWRIRDLQGKGIRGFGKTEMDKQNSRSAQESLEKQDKNLTSGTGERAGEDGSKKFSRFVVPFLDEAEARRFLRNWHRRQFNFRMGDTEKDSPSWEETITLNATYLW